MSCDLVTFPFFGAFAPCSDKQLKKTKTNKNIKHSDGQSLLRDLQTGQRLRPLPSSVVASGYGVERGTQGEGQELLQAPPGMPLGWYILARSSVVNHEGPQGESQTSWPRSSAWQARAAAHRPGGGGKNPTPWPHGPALLTSDLQVGEGLHRNGDAERQQRERGDWAAQGRPRKILVQGYHDSFKDRIPQLSPAFFPQQPTCSLEL